MSTIVNYVWMSKDKSSPPPIPTYFFCRVQENADRYADTQFRVWVENQALCEPYAIPVNVTVHTLNTIPAFSTIPVMSSDNHRHIWAKVDIARLLILQHSIRQPDCKTAIYTDFDVEDVFVKAKALTARLKKYGVAFGSTMDPETKTLDGFFENGYMAIQKKADDLLEFAISYVIPKINDNRNCIYFALDSAFKCWAAKEAHERKNPFPENWREDVGGFPVLFPCEWREDTHLKATLAANATPKASYIPARPARKKTPTNAMLLTA